jgi:hypothetical protein
MLVELGLVEQRYAAVLEVLGDGATVVDVARRYGVARQTVHVWLGRYAAEGGRGLADRSSRPLSCPHQMDPVVEARIVELRGEHSGWGPAHDPVLAGAGGRHAAAGAHVGGALPGPPRAGDPPRPAGGSVAFARWIIEGVSWVDRRIDSAGIRSGPLSA